MSDKIHFFTINLRQKNDKISCSQNIKIIYLVVSVLPTLRKVSKTRDNLNKLRATKLFLPGFIYDKKTTNCHAVKIVTILFLLFLFR